MMFIFINQKITKLFRIIILMTILIVTDAAGEMKVFAGFYLKNTIPVGKKIFFTEG